jgi:RNA polymerase sigma-70 factor (ECF subfamily)
MKTKEKTKVHDNVADDCQTAIVNNDVQNVSDIEKCSLIGKTELVIRLKQGDERAFETLFYLYKNKILFFLLCKVNSIEEAEDIIQDVFMKLWIERENLDKISNLNTYIFKIAQNHMIDRFRKFSKGKTLLADIYFMNETPENILLYTEKQLLLQKAVSQLSPQQKNIYRLHYEQGRLLKDIAKEMHLSLSTVQNHINKMIKNIYKYFEKNIFDIGVFSCLHVYIL